MKKPKRKLPTRRDVYQTLQVANQLCQAIDHTAGVLGRLSILADRCRQTIQAVLDKCELDDE